MHKEHPSFNPPKNQTAKIWRYTDLAKLLAILEDNTLFFPNITNLDDPLEGFLNRATVLNFRRLPADLIGNAKEKTREIHEKNLRLIKESRKLLSVSSWHISEHESAAMWQLYSKNNEGIAIQSTYERLTDSFHYEKKDVFIGKIKYIDEDNDLIDWTNLFNFALHKRKSFEHEKELRAIISFPSATGGSPVVINTERLIEKIYVAPDSPQWLFELIQKIIKRYGLKIPVEKSRMYEDPLY